MRKNLAVAYHRMGDDARAVAVLEKVPREDWGKLGIKQLLEDARRGLESKL